METINPIQETNPNPPIQQPEVQPTPKQKGFFFPIIAVVLLVLVVGAGAYFLGKSRPSNPPSNSVLPTANPNDQATNWKIYSDTKYSIQYPPYWSQLIGKDGSVYLGPDGQHVKSEADTGVPSNSGYVVVVSTEDKRALDAESRKIEEDMFEGYKARGYSNVQIDGITAVTIPKYGLDLPRVHTQFMKDGFQYSIQLRFYDEKYYKLQDQASEQALRDYPEALSTYNQMLSTFKFIDQSQNLTTPNLKTYENKKMKFSFSYPDTYEFEKEDANKATFSGTYDIQKIPGVLTVNFQRTIDVASLKSCTPQQQSGTCIEGNVETKNFNGIEMKAYNLLIQHGQEQTSSQYVVEVTNPAIEFVHVVLGGGVQRNMDEILKTLSSVN